MGFMGATADDRGAYSTLEQNLVGPSRDEVLPVSQATVRTYVCFESIGRQAPETTKISRTKQSTLAQRFRVVEAAGGPGALESPSCSRRKGRDLLVAIDSETIV